MRTVIKAYMGRKTRKKRERTWSSFLINISIVIIVFTLGIFMGLMFRSNQLINNEVKTRARAHVSQIIKTREWNAHYGGVYVEKKAGVESNPYLENPDIETKDGRFFTLKNPALMTREISDLSQKDSMLAFHLTSLKPINPKNSPDSFEVDALTLFAGGTREVFAKEKHGERTDFRYMIPLVTEENCLQCHRMQGYKVGDIRGGISVRFDITAIEETMERNNIIIVILGIISAGTLLVIIYSFTFLLKNKLERAQAKIKELAITDELTGLYNRRYFYSKLNDEVRRAKRFRHEISCILLDIDHFKEVNDRHGHLVGDLVLKRAAETILDCCREIDTIARYGGEEYIIIMPGTNLRGSCIVAEKIRTAIEQLNPRYEKDLEVPVTVSLGVAAFSYDNLKNMSDNDEMIMQADRALYRAKENGRNRIATA